METNRVLNPVSPPPRFDRLVTLMVLVVLGLAVIFLIDINPDIIRARLGADLPVITVSWLLIAALVLLTALGADVLIRAHPEMQARTLPGVQLGKIRLEFVPTFWILPGLTVVAAFAFFRLFSAPLAGLSFVLALLIGSLLLCATLVAQHYALDRQGETARAARGVLRAVALLVGFALFSAVFYARMRTLYSAALIGGVAALLALALLHWSNRRGLITLAGLVGLALAEATWALNYWAAPFVLAGALLLVFFYIATSLIQHHLDGDLAPRVLWEYGLLGGGLLLAVIFATFR